MDFLEPPEHQELRSAIGAVTDKYGSDYFAERAAAGEPTTELWTDLAEHGFIGMIWPKKYGGHERTALERYVMTEEMLAGGAPVGAHWVSDRQSGHQILIEQMPPTSMRISL